jgi:hypothetical protein
LLVERERSVLQAPDERGDGTAVDAGLPVEGAGGLAADGCAEHAEARRLVRGADHLECRRLARAGDTDDHVERPAGGSDGDGCLPLAVGQLASERTLLGSDGCLDGCSVASTEAAAQARPRAPGWPTSGIASGCWSTPATTWSSSATEQP